MTSGVRTLILLAAIFALALALRFSGLDSGLPLLHPRIDEGLYENATRRMARDGTLDPGFYNYPGFALYSFYGIQRLYHVAAGVVGTDIGRMAFADYAAARPDEVVLVNRVASAFFGAATVLLCFLLGRAVSSGRAGLVAAFLVAVAYVLVREAHFGLIDTPLAFLVCLSLLAILRAARRGTIGSLLLAAAVSGLTTAAKYPAATLCFPIAGAHLLASRDRGVSPVRALASPRLVGAAAVMIAFFLLGAPYTLLEFGSFIRGFGLEVVHFEGQGYPSDLTRGWVRHPTFTLLHGLGIPLLIGCAIGLVHAAARPGRGAGLVALFVVGYFFVMGYGRTTLVRYVVPLVPPLLVLVGRSVDAAAARAGGKRMQAACVVAATLALASISIVRSVGYAAVVRRTDTRLLAREWILENVGPGETVMAWSDLARTVPDRRVIDYHPARLLRGEVQYLVVRRYFARFQLGLDRILDKGVAAEEVASFPHLEPGTEAVYDPFEEILFVPLVGLAGTIRPGPHVRIYRVRPLDEPADPAPPPPPSDLRVDVKVSDVHLSWKRPADTSRVLCYLLYMVPESQARAAGAYVPVAFVAPEDETLTVPLVPSGRYYVGLSSLGLGAESARALAFAAW